MRSPLLSALIYSLVLFGGNGEHVRAAATSYANVFVDPDFIVARQFPNNTLAAQQTIVSWAQELAAEGPWSTSKICIFLTLEGLKRFLAVMSKNVTPPSGDKHDYLSWAP
jgi:hypothetical protein